jgi:UDP-3-O-[3-hydroxymyristoyl] glucosamine N-acyltransferase
MQFNNLKLTTFINEKVIVLLFLVSALVFTYFFDQNDFGIPCVFKLLTHLDCPGCGMSRAIILALKAEFLKSVLLGENIYVASGVIISSFAKVEDNVLLNFGVLIGHDSIIKENCILLPGSKIGGGVVLNENVLIGSGTFIKQGVSIGKNTFIDAMCYIEKNIEENKMCRSKIEIKQYKNIFL